MNIFKIVGLSLIVVVLLGFVFIGLLGTRKTQQIESSPKQKLFLSGKIPDPSPDGFYKGNAFTGFGKDWQGKVFDASKNSGINKFADGKRYVFKTYEAKGLRDKNLKVLRIDYSQPGNPWWLKFIVDEIVETSPGHYLGKMHLNVIPGMPFTLTYFELTK